MKNDKVILGLLAGVAAGAVIGVLYAPNKGCETRKKISSKKTDTINSLKQKYEDLLNKFNEKYDTAKDEVEDLYDEGVSKVKDAKKEIKQSLS